MIAICQIDGKIPNLALMKVAGFYESQGIDVEHFNAFNTYDKVYASKIFSFSEMPILPENAIIGGTGIDFYNKLPDEIENSKPSYSLYQNCNYHIGFSMKGCRLRCDFCCVPKKEGMARHESDIKNLLLNPKGENRLMLLDNDFFGNKLWLDRIKEIIDLKLKVCFVQGLNIRVITEEQSHWLAKTNFFSSTFKTKQLTFAWDSIKDERLVLRGIKRLNDAGIKNYQMQFFVLVGFNSTKEDDLHRIYALHDLGCKPFVMPFNKNDSYQSDLARWCNKRQIINSQPNFDSYKKTVIKKETGNQLSIF